MSGRLRKPPSSRELESGSPDPDPAPAPGSAELRQLRKKDFSRRVPGVWRLHDTTVLLSQGPASLVPGRVAVELDPPLGPPARDGHPISRRSAGQPGDSRVSIRVIVRDHEPVEKALRRLKRLCKEEGIDQAVKSKKFYEKPSDRKRRKAKDRMKIIRMAHRLRAKGF